MHGSTRHRRHRAARARASTTTSTSPTSPGSRARDRSGCASATAASWRRACRSSRRRATSSSSSSGGRPTRCIDIVSRICGICPVAYQMSAVHAFEHLFGVEIDPQVRALRRLLYCGEWIQSPRAAHLPAPRPGLPGLPVGDRDGRRPQAGRRPRPGDQEGRQPDPEHPRRPRDPSDQRARRRVLEGAPARCARRPPPSAGRRGRRCRRDHPDGGRVRRARSTTASRKLVSLVHPTEYPYNHGRIKSSDGLDLPVDRWDDAFEEIQVEGTNALQARTHDGGVYLLGPAARMTLSPGSLHPMAAEALARTGLADVIRTNIYWSIAARAIELAPRLRRSARPHRRLSAPGRAEGRLEAATGSRRMGDRGAARACSSTATRSTTAGSSRPPRSSRRRARTRPRSSPTWPNSRRASSTCRTRKPPCASSS